VIFLDKNELEKCKKDIVYFVEKYLGYELREWQKEMFKRLQKGESVK
jgi:spore cortex formation protein SpoVR/YcgB (stage V sporulation)